MCDYSLMGLPNRLAKEGEELVLYRFPTATKGFASPADIACCCKSSSREPGLWETFKNMFRAPELDSVPAVCVPPGTRLMLHDIPVELQHALDVDSVEPVTFTQLSSAVNSHRDAVHFRNGSEISLQRLREGQRAKILRFDSDMELLPVQWDDMAMR